MTVAKTGAKGYAAEEALRNYFRDAGYFVVRGIPFSYKAYDVTDVDLWLYARGTSLAAERACVDVKRRRTPQAMERVLWTRGLKELLRVDHAIVVTSDDRQETRDFGHAHGVKVMQGAFLQGVISNFPPVDRLTEEELSGCLRTPCVVDPSIDWRAWFRRAKAKLLDSLNFDGCNVFIMAVKLLFDEYTATGRSSESAVRLLYAITAYLLICIDYVSRAFAHLDLADRRIMLAEGVRFGEAGPKRTEEIVHMALRLLESAGKADVFSEGALRGEVSVQISEYRAEIIAEHFAKPESLEGLFERACGFETLAYARKLVRPHDCASEHKAVIGLLCDFLGYDRKNLI